MFYILITPLIGLLILCVVAMIRNFRVFSMREKLRKGVFRNEGDWIKRLKIYDKVSYQRMMMDLFRPCKPETYFTKEEIDEMLYN